jgi:hypothetical protein
MMSSQASVIELCQRVLPTSGPAVVCAQYTHAVTVALGAPDALCAHPVRLHMITV